MSNRERVAYHLERSKLLERQAMAGDYNQRTYGIMTMLADTAYHQYTSLRDFGHLPEPDLEFERRCKAIYLGN